VLSASVSEGTVSVEPPKSRTALGHKIILALGPSEEIFLTVKLLSTVKVESASKERVLIVNNVLITKFSPTI